MMNSDRSRNAALRLRLRNKAAPLLLPGAPNALTARLLEDVGFESIYISGAGVANAFLGVPDVGLLTLSELASHVATIREAVDVPLIVDADTGFGNAAGVQHSVRVLERAGANGIQIEDQVFPKRCGHFEGKSIIPIQEMRDKIDSALNAREDENLLVIARTDARAGFGITEACERAQSYKEAGADVLFVEAPQSALELREIAKNLPEAILMANMVEGGQTPLSPLSDLSEWGYGVVLYANTAARAGIAGMRAVVTHLKDTGDTMGVLGQIASWDERQALVNKDTFDALERRYAHDGEVF